MKNFNPLNLLFLYQIYAISVSEDGELPGLYEDYIGHYQDNFRYHTTN